MKQNNNSAKKKSKREVKKETSVEIDLKAHSLHQLYDMAEKEYQALSEAQHTKWHAIISRGGTRKDKIGLMATQIVENPHTCLQQFGELTKWCFDSNHHFALDSCRALVNVYNEYVFKDKNTLRIFFDSVQERIKLAKKQCMATLPDLVGLYLEHHIKHYYG